MSQRIVILTSDEDGGKTLYKALSPLVSVVGIIIEQPIGGMTILKRRIKRFGFFNAIGQALFVKLLAPVLRSNAKARIKELEEKYDLAPKEPVPTELIHRVESVNSDEARTILKTLAPTRIVVYGTRLISGKTLEQIKVPFINIHAGITPEYRGGQGGYWALAEGKPDLCGVTVHYIDKGIDTGSVLKQNRIEPTKADSFVTYPLLQFAAGIAILKEFVPMENLPEGQHHAPTEGIVYAHPTIWGYLSRRIMHNVR